ncbi:hypothetical protein PIB30_065803 [Stylosanthes scabra]|uniref:SWIM-type domain-containing protein n=1 Tax=Stylosanthes scabra TaxID=79078 RepID=A0ABU6SNI0_9FABA|nr:hypothetical protein [Stylosanthes scabra]
MGKIVWESCSQDLFESAWHDFIEDYSLGDNKWLNDKEQKELECDATDNKGGNCSLSPRVVKDNKYFYGVTQQKIVYGMSVYSEYVVVFCLVSEEVWCNCLMLESSGILCCHSFSVLCRLQIDKDFVQDEEEADILYSSFMVAKLALKEHRTKKAKTIGTSTTKTLPTASECPVGLSALKSPPCMVPRGRPTHKRLGVDMD